MKKMLLYLLVVIFSVNFILGSPSKNSLSTPVLEPWTYSENFEDHDRTLGAWASYPLWQDTAYDPNFRVNEIVPGDPNLSIVQKVTPYANVDNYAGAQKLLNMYLVPGSTIKLRYYIKSNQEAEFFKVRFAAGKYGKIDVTIPNPKNNEWVWLTVNYEDFIRENPKIRNEEKIKIYALAFLTKIPNADPSMPFYLGLDDITFKGKRASTFKFAEPAMIKLPEVDYYIPKDDYIHGDNFSLGGRWDLDATKVNLKIFPLTDSTETKFKGSLQKRGDQWNLKPLKLNFPEGIYIGRLLALNGTDTLSRTEFTIHIAPGKTIAGKHPRLLFDSEKKMWMDKRFKEDRFHDVYQDIADKAKKEREEIPVESLIFDLDQFPEEDWLPTWSAWGSHIYHTAEALRWNARAYSFHGDKEAGLYTKNVLLKLSEWPNWTHPWQTNRGRFSEHRTGSWSHRVAEAYDLTYDLMTPEESQKIRTAIMENIVKNAYRTYVYNDNVTSATSNWLNMVLGGSIMNMAAIYADGPATLNLEPYFTGSMLKFYKFLNRVTDSKDGAYGEGLGYNSYTFSNTAYSLPSIKNVFNIDLSKPLRGTYKEYIWGGIIKERRWFEFGDSGNHLNPPTNWAFLLDMQKEPRLGWYYNYLKNGLTESNTKGSNSDVDKKENDNNSGIQTYQDVLYDTENVPMDSPFDENPVKVFRKIGTTVFKSGWDTDDFVFVMRTGPFFNHQHLDQGSFQLADRGEIFLEDGNLEKSNYYDDPLYQPWLTQPIGHSTILIDGNPQSQRVGDPLNFAPGFNDHAFISHFLNGDNAAFSSGNIGKLYWGKVKSLTRNVLYLKPRTLLMLDVIVPEKKDIDVTLLYHTRQLEDIKAGQEVSAIVKDKATLYIRHLSPESIETEAVETPHYLKTLLNERPLQREGMLTVTGHTESEPLVMANLLTTTTGIDPEISVVQGDGFMSGVASGKDFAFTIHPGETYKIDNMETDALTMTWDDERIFAAMATTLRRSGTIMLKSEHPVTFELNSVGQLKFYMQEAGVLLIGSETKPASVLLNGKEIKDFKYNVKEKVIEINVPQGEGVITIN